MSEPPVDPPVFDPYELTPEAIEEPPASLGLALRRIGPGLILAASIVGTGELIATTNLGAKVGFALLWLVLVSCFIKVFVQVELGRYAISSGEPTLASFQQLGFPGVLLTWWWLLMLFAVQTQVGAMVGGIGQACHVAFPGVSPWLASWLATDYLTMHPDFPWAVLVALVTAALLAKGSYRLVERTATFLVMIFTFMTVACVAFLPLTGHPIHWNEMAGGLTFAIPAGTAIAAMTMFGITGVGAAELIAYPYWCVEKGYARFTGQRDATAAWAERAKGWVRVMLLDAWVSMGVYTVATLAFFVLGAAVLFEQTAGQGLPGSVAGMIDVLGQMYVPVLGEGTATAFIVIGAFTVLYSTLFSATAANARALTDFLFVTRLAQVRHHGERMWWIRVFCIGFSLLALVLFTFVRDPVLLVSIGAMAQALTLPMLAMAAVFLRYRRTDARLAPGKVWDGFLILSMLGMMLAAGWLVWDTVAKLL